MPTSKHAGDRPAWLLDFVQETTAGDAEQKEPAPRGKLRTLGDVLKPVMKAIEAGAPPVRWTPADKPWGNLEFRPRSLLTIGGPANGGKTALVLDALSRVLTRYPDLRVVFASNDMDGADLSQRLLANASGVNYRHIRDNAVAETDANAIKAGRAAIKQFHDRLAIVERPFTMATLREDVVAFRADIVVLDSLQATDTGARIHENQQQHVARIMRSLRALADSGPCVVATSAWSRNGVAHMRSRVGKTEVDPGDMSAFAHGHEIEYECDVLLALLAERGEQLAIGEKSRGVRTKFWLQAVKGRNIEKKLVPLWFDGNTQRLELRDDADASAANNGTQNSKKKRSAVSDVIATPDEPDGNGTNWLS